MTEFWNNLKLVLSAKSVEMLLTVLVACVVLVVGFRLIKWLLRLSQKSRAAQKLDPSVRSFWQSFLSIALKVVLIVIVAGIVGVPTASIVAVLGSAGLAIGLALQGSLSNFAGGVMILLFKPFLAGDYIEVSGSADARGVVTDISIFYTTLRTYDNRRIVVPNGAVSNATLVNFSSLPTRRVDLTLAAGYRAKPAEVSALLLALAAADPRVLAEPAPFARMTKMGDSALEFTLRAWCETGDYWDLLYDLTERAKAAFDEHGIEIPYPQMDVHVK